MVDPLLGQISIVPYTFPPRDWTFCSGQLLPISENQALYSLIGSIYGGDDRTVFGIPDLRGRIPVGSSHMGTSPSVQFTPPLGYMGGSNTVTLDISEMPEHTHLATVSGTQLDLTVKQPAKNANGNIENPSPSNVPAIGNVPSGGMTPTQSKGYSSDSGDTYLPDCEVSGSVAVSVVNSNSGGDGAHDNMQPYLGLNYVIALDGTYPSRN